MKSSVGVYEEESGVELEPCSLSQATYSMETTQLLTKQALKP